jgi:EmrB/QacA subfamily drug resistance transporter
VPVETSASGNLTHRQIVVILSGLMMGSFLASLDHTILATALPTIVGDLGGLNQLSWVATAYLLTTTISLPLFGKIGDLYGRKRIFQAAVLIFVAGSALCGIASSIGELILFRALQGIGSGGLMATTTAIIGDVIAPRQRGKYQAYLMGANMVATVVGPLLGGVLVDHASWRWTFYVNVPVGLAAVAVTSKALKLPVRRIEHAVDYAGAALLAGATASLLLVMVWGGDQYAWTSFEIIGLGVLSVLLTALFCWQETRAKEPIMRLGLWHNATLRISSGAQFISGIAMFGAIFFLPVFLQTVKGSTATNSGLLLVPVVAGMLVSSYVAGRLVARTGKYRIYPILGLGTSAVTLWLLSTMSSTTPGLVITMYMVMFGLGMGMTQGMLVLAVQNSVEARDLGVATGMVTFFRSIGQSFGVAAFGAIVNGSVVHYLHRYVANADRLGDVKRLINSPTVIRHLPAATHRGVVRALSESIHWGFLAAVPITVVGVVLAMRLREAPLRETSHVGSDPDHAVASELELVPSTVGAPGARLAVEPEPI